MQHRDGLRSRGTTLINPLRVPQRRPAIGYLPGLPNAENRCGRTSSKLPREIEATGRLMKRPFPALTLVVCVVGAGCGDTPTRPSDEVPLAFAVVAPGAYHTCGLTQDGDIYCWGSNSDGELGTGTGGNSWRPVLVAGERKYTSVSSGYARSCALAADGQLFCWGRGYGPAPRGVSGPKLTVISLGVTDENTCGLTASGAAYCWGENTYGQVGDGSTLPRSSPVQVGLEDGLIDIAASGSHACALRDDMMAYCWGTDAQGRTGTTETPSSCAEGPPCRYPTPAPVRGGFAFTRITTGAGQSCGLDPDGRAYCWGSDLNGELGGDAQSTCHPAVPCSPSPVPVTGDHAFSAIRAGLYHTCAVTLSGAGYCWGLNTGGQLGNGGGSNAAKPAQVSGALEFVSIQPGVYHTCGIVEDGRAYCWGGNLAGALGDGSVERRLTPVAVLAPI